MSFFFQALSDICQKVVQDKCCLTVVVVACSGTNDCCFVSQSENLTSKEKTLLELVVESVRLAFVHLKK